MDSTSETCSLIHIDDVDTSCNTQDDSVLITEWENSCEGKADCELTLSDDFFDYSGDSCFEKAQRSVVYMKAFCESDELKIGRNDYTSKRFIALTVATLDAVIMFVFLIMVITLKPAIAKATRNVLKYAYSPKIFTVMITRLPQLTPDDLYAKLWNFLEGHVREEVGSSVQIVDMQLFTSNKILDLNIEIGDLTIKVRLLLLANRVVTCTIEKQEDQRVC